MAVSMKRASLSTAPQTSRYIAGCFYTDTSGVFRSELNAAAGDAGKHTTTLQAAMNAGTRTQWLILCRPQGVLEVMLFLSRIDDP